MKEHDNVSREFLRVTAHLQGHTFGNETVGNVTEG
jgi:hypothetical protein